MTAQHLRVAAAAIVWAAPVIAFSPSLVAPGGPLPVRLSSRPQVPGVTLLRPTTGLRAPALQMAGAGGAAVNLDSSDFDQGDADPIGSIDALNQAVPRPKITELIKQSSDTEGFKQVLWHVGSYVLCAVAFAGFSAMQLAPAAALAMVGMAAVMACNFMPLHECVHRSAFKSRVWNDVFMHVAGVLTMRPAMHYFYYHWAHHKFTGDPSKDSELIPSALDMDVSTWSGYLLYISGLPFWFDAITTTLKHAAGICPEHYLTADKAKHEVTTEARVYTGFYLSLLAASLLSPAFAAGLWTYAVLPSVLGQPFLRFYLMAEHRGCQESTNVLENTRTMQTNWLIRKMTWQMPYHLEHHAWPYVPFHKLAEANKLVTASGGWSSDTCAPSGDDGYVELNKQVFSSLILKPTV